MLFFNLHPKQKAKATKSNLNKEEIIKSYKEAKLVFMVTFDKNDKPHSRPMTNFNENPYETMWFPTATKTQKVAEIKNNQKTLIIFPCKNKDEFYEIEGHSSLASQEEVDEKWVWCYL